MPTKADTAKMAARPLSPMVMDFELEAWLMRILSQGHESKQSHSHWVRFDRDQAAPFGESAAAWRSGFASGINGLTHAAGSRHAPSENLST
jgi:hypothetical protein